MKSFLINSRYGEIGIIQISVDTFHLTCIVDGHSAIAIRDAAGKWTVTNGEGISTPKMIEGASHVGELIEEELQKTEA